MRGDSETCQEANVFPWTNAKHGAMTVESSPGRTAPSSVAARRGLPERGNRFSLTIALKDAYKSQTPRSTRSGSLANDSASKVSACVFVYEYVFVAMHFHFLTTEILWY